METFAFSHTFMGLSNLMQPAIVKLHRSIICHYKVFLFLYSVLFMCICL